MSDQLITKSAGTIGLKQNPEDGTTSTLQYQKRNLANNKKYFCYLNLFKPFIINY